LLATTFWETTPMTEMTPTAANPAVTTCGPIEGFTPGIGRYVAQLAETRAELLSQLDGLTPEQLAWHPNDDTESIGTQLLHVAAIEWSWIYQDIFGRPDEAYDGWEEAFPLRIGHPQVSGKPLTYFTDRLERVRGEVLATLREMTDDDLPRLVGEAEPSEGEEPRARLYSIDWILFHLVHHEAHHAGQVELLRRLLPE
jgi:uncharacterized damage-inducible protein DinB